MPARNADTGKKSAEIRIEEENLLRTASNA
jgi:hypothetical protein